MTFRWGPVRKIGYRPRRPCEPLHWPRASHSWRRWPGGPLGRHWPSRRWRRAEAGRPGPAGHSCHVALTTLPACLAQPVTAPARPRAVPRTRRWSGELRLFLGRLVPQPRSRLVVKARTPPALGPRSQPVSPLRTGEATRMPPQIDSPSTSDVSALGLGRRAASRGGRGKRPRRSPPWCYGRVVLQCDDRNHGRCGTSGSPSIGGNGRTLPPGPASALFAHPSGERRFWLPAPCGPSCQR